MYLLDTNTIIDYLGGKFYSNAKNNLDKIIDEEINISVINKIELLSFSKLEQNLFDFVNESNVYKLDEDIVDQTIKIRKEHRIKLPDAIIAATALLFNFTLITNNTKDFKKLEQLNVINPYHDF
jgi:predicted nucleic acid-binding protein